MKTRKRIHTQIIHDGKKYVKVSVPITVHLFMLNGKEEEAVPCDEWRKVELAIEKVSPGWFHVITENGKHDKQNCPRCIRDKNLACLLNKL